MTMKTLLILTASLAAVAPAAAETTYYGTSERMPVARQQNNADAAATAQSASNDARLSGMSEVRSFGYPGALTAAGAGRSDTANGFTGTRWRTDDNADDNMG
ncbi:hypothetical protein [Aureimonas mangrovi]|uniref:hypothetical protein n=1 Tax=Aureimonas mangrovi TaxID=2758041 RepID=UPI00163D9255|nr:hypothetical protein [Aureimonas mangrovi]